MSDPRMTALALAIRVADLDEGDFERAFAAVEGLTPQDRAELLRYGPKRLLAYRRMVHNRFRRVIASWLPRTHARLGDRYVAEVDAFTQESAATDPYFRTVPSAFVAWARDRWPGQAGIAPYMAELAQYECLCVDVRVAPPSPPLGGPIALARGIIVAPSVALRRFNYAVDTLPTDPESTGVLPEAGPRRLLAFRHGHDTKWKVLSELGARLVEALSAGQTLQAAIASACEAAELEVGDDALARIAILLKEFGDDGVFLGAR